jgi:hypothetical protein
MMAKLRCNYPIGKGDVLLQVNIEPFAQPTCPMNAFRFIRVVLNVDLRCSISDPKEIDSFSYSKPGKNNQHSVNR